MKTITDSNIEETLSSDKLVILDFSAPWCKVCVTIEPIIEELSNEYSEDVIIGKVNVDENPLTPKKYSIRSIPAVLFIKNGEVLDKTIGAASKSEFSKKIETYK